ncbi:MAG: type II secretion system protein [Patescibacteria group bacterium]
MPSLLKAKSYKLKASRGFTLIELLVAIGVFSVVVSIAVGGFVSALRSQRQAAALLAANSNVSLTIEQMAREIRTGFDFCRSQACAAGQLIFKNARQETVLYCLAGDNSIRRGVGSVNCDTAKKITADNVLIQHLSFEVIGRYPPNNPVSPDSYQPRVVISMGVSAKEVGVSGSVTYIQTTVSSRLPLDDGSS